METIAIRFQRGDQMSQDILDRLLATPTSEQPGGLLDETKFSLYTNSHDSNECILVARFPKKEFERVTRAAWPFVILQLIDVLRTLQEKSEGINGAVEGNEKTVSELLDGLGGWNDQFGRFSRLSIGTK